MCYAMVCSIPHAIAYGMHHLVCKGISHDHVVCFLAMWNAFYHVVCFFKPTVCFFKTEENFNLGYLKVRN